ncbi:MAG: hypothetical protein J5826_05595 [Bacteroidales bacterium]|nr:hypothetical protein [Bacteroidales bacterium]
MKRFDDNFRTKLYEGVAEIENNSQAEAVVIIKKSSGRYTSYSFCAAAIICFVVFTFFMFAPIDFDAYFMYGCSVIVFGAALALFTFVPALQRLIVPKKVRRKNAEIYARAIFQKGMIYNTIEHTGFLIYCSVTEKEAVFMPDHGITLLFDDADMQKLNSMVNNIFAANDVPAEILSVMHQSVPIFAKYLPHREDDINELPDDLDVDL